MNNRIEGSARALPSTEIHYKELHLNRPPSLPHLSNVFCYGSACPVSCEYFMKIKSEVITGSSSYVSGSFCKRRRKDRSR